MIIYLDTNVVIYFVEHNPVWWAKATARLAAASAAGNTFGISDLTRMECLVGPYRSGDVRLEADFTTFFTRPDVRVFALSPALCERAARVRALHPRFRTPDALNLAAAVENGCGLFLTNDAQLAHFPDVLVEVLT